MAAAWRQQAKQARISLACIGHGEKAARVKRRSIMA